MHNPPRLVLAFVMAAAQLGAQVANYVEAERLLLKDKRVYGVAARDTLTGDRFEIRARVVLNAAGPWAEGLLKGISARKAIAPSNWSRDACFVINRRPNGPWALALQGVTHDGDAMLKRGARHLFMVPWRDRMLVGVIQAYQVRRARDGAPVETVSATTFLQVLSFAVAPTRRPVRSAA